MTEEEWLAATDPRPMLAFLRDKVSDRKLRLFACACWRRTPELKSHPRLNEWIDAGERHADDLTIRDELVLLQRQLIQELADENHISPLSWRVGHLMWDDAYYGAMFSLPPLIGVGGESSPSYASPSDYCQLLRCVFGSPCPRPVRNRFRWLKSAGMGLLKLAAGHPSFRNAPKPDEPISLRTVSFDPAWHTSTTVALARGMYESRDFSAMPILADALQDAGCDSADILGHCRGPGPHARGCWVVDLVLGKD
jgi:hypothetical protein